MAVYHCERRGSPCRGRRNLRLAPEINRLYQIDQARSSHVAQTTDKLNNEIIILSQKIRRLNDSFVNDGSDAASLRQDCLDQVTKLQWILVDLEVILKDEGDQAALGELSDSIEGVRSALMASKGTEAQPLLLSAMSKLGKSTRIVLGRLYEVASLK